MTESSDPRYLMTHQYQNASNLNARQRLHARFSTNKLGWHLWIFDQINSMNRVKTILVGDKLAEFINFVEEELTLHAVINITKDAGIFEAHREEGRRDKGKRR